MDRKLLKGIIVGLFLSTILWVVLFQVVETLWRSTTGVQSAFRVIQGKVAVLLSR
jgi:predicted small integral membrane protein